MSSEELIKKGLGNILNAAFIFCMYIHHVKFSHLCSLENESTIYLNSDNMQPCEVLSN